MRQLGGQLELTSTPQGTTVRGMLPAEWATSEATKLTV